MSRSQSATVGGVSYPAVLLKLLGAPLDSLGFALHFLAEHVTYSLNRVGNVELLKATAVCTIGCIVATSAKSQLLGSATENPFNEIVNLKVTED